MDSVPFEFPREKGDQMGAGSAMPWQAISDSTVIVCILVALKSKISVLDRWWFGSVQATFLYPAWFIQHQTFDSEKTNPSLYSTLCYNPSTLSRHVQLISHIFSQQYRLKESPPRLVRKLG